MYYIIIIMGFVLSVVGMIIFLMDHKVHQEMENMYKRVKAISTGRLIEENQDGSIYKYGTVDELCRDMEIINRLKPEGLHLQADLNRLEMEIYK